jgi:hypothetical protein
MYRFCQINIDCQLIVALREWIKGEKCQKVPGLVVHVASVGLPPQRLVRLRPQDRKIATAATAFLDGAGCRPGICFRLPLSLFLT